MDRYTLIALTLLAIRAVTVWAFVKVLTQQIRLLKSTVTDYPPVRKIIIFMLTVALLSNVLPIVIDLSVLIDRRVTSTLLIPYFYSNAIAMAVMAITWKYLYEVIEKERQRILGLDTKLRKRNKKRRKA